MENNKIIGVFEEEERLVEALHKLKASGIEVEDVYSPYPVHEAIEMVGKHSRIPVVAYFYGWLGATGVLAFLYWSAVKSWPINYGGKPFNAFPSFIIVTLILTIFTITILSLFTFSARSKLYPGKKAEILDERVTDDRFFIIVNAGDGTAAGIMKEQGAIEIRNKS